MTLPFTRMELWKSKWSVVVELHKLSLRCVGFKMNLKYLNIDSKVGIDPQTWRKGLEKRE